MEASPIRRSYGEHDPITDDQLVARVRTGDEGAFEAIYDRHHRGILSFCRHMLGSRDDAEDAVQQTFVSAYRDMSGSSKPIRLKPWLYAIARNRCLSMLRARRPVVALEDAEPSTEGLSEVVQRREDLRDMLRDLGELPPDQRAALLLAELGALSHDEVAAVLAVRRDKVKALVFQARESLAVSRSARDTDCQEIREQLSTLSGGALRRSSLRRHLGVCAGCREFREEMRRQRRSLGLLLPVVPGAALRAETVQAACGVGSATAGGASGAVFQILGGGAKGLAAKAAVVAAVAASGAFLVTGGDEAESDTPSGAGPAGPAIAQQPPRTAAPLGVRPARSHGDTASPAAHRRDAVRRVRRDAAPKRAVWRAATAPRVTAPAVRPRRVARRSPAGSARA